MSAKEAEIWAAAEPIELALSKICKSLEADPDVQDRLKALRAKRKPTTLTIGIIDHSEDDKRNLEKIATDELVKRLISAEHVSIGLVSTQSGERVLTRVPKEFWPGANFDVKNAIVENGDQRFRDVRIHPPICPERTATRSSVPVIQAREPNQKPNAPGRPSHGEAIKAVINACVIEFGGHWWNKKPEDRFSRYRALLQADYGFEDKIGLSTKTFQKYETDHKKRSN